jgi:hypothetical protein
MPARTTHPDAVNVMPDDLRKLPLLASFQPGNAPVKGVTVRGDFAYAVSGYGGFFVVDVSDPGELKLVGQCDTPGNATEVALRGNYAYVADRPAGVQIIDISDPADPQIAGLYDSVELATGLDISGNLMAICNRTCGVEFVDLADPVRPNHLSALRVGEAQGVRIRDNLAYVGLWHNRKLAIVDTSDPTRPMLRGEASLGGYGWGLGVRDDLVYAATGHHAPGAGGENRGHGLDVVDVSDPSNPHSIARLNTPPHYRLGNDWWWTAASGNCLFHADGENGVFVYDLGDPTSPAPIARAETADYAGAVALLPDRILVADMKGGLRLFEAKGLSTPVDRPAAPATEMPAGRPLPATSPGVALHQTNGQARAVAIAADHALVAAGMGGLEVWALSPPGRVATLDLPGVAFDVQVQGNAAYVALGSGGVAVLDTSNPTRPGIIGRWDSRAADHVGRVGDYLAAMRGEGGIDFLDLGKPSSPSAVSRASIPHFPSQLSALDDRRLLGVSPWEIALFDLADARQPGKTVLSKADRDGAAGLMVNGTRALVCRASALELWDLADLDNIRVLTFVGLREWTGGVVYWDGTRAVISNRPSGAVTFAEVVNGHELRVLKQTAFPGYPARALIHNDLVVIPCGYTGLATIKWEDIPGLP